MSNQACDLSSTSQSPGTGDKQKVNKQFPVLVKYNEGNKTEHCDEEDRGLLQMGLPREGSLRKKDVADH